MPSEIARQFAAARERAAKAVLKDGRDGVTAARELSEDVDEILRVQAGPLVAKCPVPVAILATGGFGRRELAPYSDLDLLFLCAKEPGAEIRELAEAILHPLWDARVDAGHAVRSTAQALKLPASDLAAATALLDARFMIGNADLAGKFMDDYRKRVATTAAEDFVARLRAERQARHSRYGDTIFLLEPDLKNGPGGMRDLCMGRWAAVARFGTSEPRRLQDLGVMTERLATAFEAAREWLLRVRIAMHATAKRRQDQLRFTLQEAIAPVFCGNVPVAEGDIRPAVHPAVEALMHQFHAHAKLIRRETERLLQRAAQRDNHRRTTRPVVLHGERQPDPNFVLRDGAIEPRNERLFEEKPSEMLRIFSVAIELDAPLALWTRELIAETAAAQGAALRADPDAGQRFLDVITDVGDHATPTRLEEMHDLGLLSALMPEWEPSTGRVQHDIYHVFTVDQHALYAIARMHAIARGDLTDDFPGPTETIREVQRPVALFLGTLLHDVGKPWGKPHSDIGADMIVKIARRLHVVEEEDVRRAEFLVRQHLVMGQMSQRKDLDDLEMIADFAQLCGDEENLRELYLLTFCDLSSVAPDNLTGWKETLLRELYERTLAFLRRGADLLGAERREIVQRRQQRVAMLLSENLEGGPLEAFFRGFPARYFAENKSTRIAAHVRLMRERRKQGLASIIDLDHDNKLGVTEMSLAAADVPGLLAEVAGVLFANRIDIVDAAIYSREAAPGEEAEALDIFRVRDLYGRPVTDEHRWQKIRGELEAVIAGKQTVDSLLSRRNSAESIVAWKTPEVPTELKIDNRVSRNFSVVELITEDRPGVLYAIARTLFDLGLDIHRSKIATEANRVVDTFYVRDKGGAGKIESAERVKEIRERLTAALPRV